MSLIIGWTHPCHYSLANTAYLRFQRAQGIQTYTEFVAARRAALLAQQGPEPLVSTESVRLHTQLPSIN